MALASADYKFLIVDIGAQGKHSDGGVFKNSLMGQQFYQNKINLPSLSAISSRHTVPYVIVADEAFQLTQFAMRPYPAKNLNKQQKIFNYRLSRARHVVENTFGILASRWRIYQRPINTSLETADAVIKATVCLHNFLMDTPQYRGESYTENELETNVNNFQNMTFHNSNNYTKHAGQTRDTFADYFENKGQVDWQKNMI